MKEQIKCIDCILNKPVQIDLSGNSVKSIRYLEEQCEGDVYMGPGLTDIQINGFAGVDFNASPIEESGMLTVIQVLLKQGVTSFFPTVITNSDDTIISLLENIDSLCKRNPKIDKYIGGIHLEGPFISPSEGARGAHELRYIKAPDWELFQKFQKASGNRIKIITLCPEWENAPAFIEKCVENKIIVAIGHTNAPSEKIINAVKAGATLSTHLGNGAPLMLERNSSFIFEQLAQDKLHASLIADGFHLPDSFLKVALKMKQDRAILVSDSTMFAGMKSGVYETHIGGKVVLDDNGRLSLFSNQKLMAGAALSILDGIGKLVKSNLADIQSAWAYGSINPNRLIDIENDYLNNFKDCDFVLFKFSDKEISIIAVFKEGKLVYSANNN